MSLALLGAKPMHVRPPPGRRITVLLKGGEVIECHTTLVMGQGFNGIVIYRGRYALDERTATSWSLKPKEKT